MEKGESQINPGQVDEAKRIRISGQVTLPAELLEQIMGAVWEMGRSNEPISTIRITYDDRGQAVGAVLNGN